MVAYFVTADCYDETRRFGVWQLSLVGQAACAGILLVSCAGLACSSIYPFPGCKDTKYTPTQCAANVATYHADIPGIVQQRAEEAQHVLFVDMSTLPSDGLSGDNAERGCGRIAPIAGAKMNCGCIPRAFPRATAEAIPCHQSLTRCLAFRLGCTEAA
jgi:hypothetical protein